jgi:hypothetical protein
MAKVTIPKNAGTFRVVIARAGNYMVRNDRTGKNHIFFACRDKKQAEELRDKLNAGNHDGEITVPNRI